MTSSLDVFFLAHLGAQLRRSCGFGRVVRLRENQLVPKWESNASLLCQGDSARTRASTRLVSFALVGGGNSPRSWFCLFAAHMFRLCFIFSSLCPPHVQAASSCREGPELRRPTAFRANGAGQRPHPTVILVCTYV